MIISASRRTDIPAFYPQWFMNRVRTGGCTVPNPFNPAQVSHVSLKPEDVDAIVFWTRNPKPLLPYLAELDERGFRYYFHYTLLSYPRDIDPRSPRVEESLETFLRLAERIGPERVIWRYDPILISTKTDCQFHIDAFGMIAGVLRGYSTRSVVSFMHMYRKAQKRLMGLSKQGYQLLECTGEVLSKLLPTLASLARENGMEIRSCASKVDLEAFGIRPGKCVDGELISRVFGVSLDLKKDASQRIECGCMASKDIGMYESCLFGCVYCYATSRFERARANFMVHEPDSPSLLPTSVHNFPDRWK